MRLTRLFGVKVHLGKPEISPSFSDIPREKLLRASTLKAKRYKLLWAEDTIIDYI